MVQDVGDDLWGEPGSEGHVVPRVGRHFIVGNAPLREAEENLN